jgi:hypothetical protein
LIIANLELPINGKPIEKIELTDRLHKKVAILTGPEIPKFMPLQAVARTGPEIQYIGYHPLRPPVEAATEVL